MSEGDRQTPGMKNGTATESFVRNPPTLRRRRCESQLDFALATPPLEAASPRRPERLIRPCSRERAQWWFNQMRQVVDEGRTVDVAGVF
jgi:hypothetical protein